MQFQHSLVTYFGELIYSNMMRFTTSIIWCLLLCQGKYLYLFHHCQIVYMWAECMVNVRNVSCDDNGWLIKASTRNTVSMCSDQFMKAECRNSAECFEIIDRNTHISIRWWTCRGYRIWASSGILCICTLSCSKSSHDDVKFCWLYGFACIVFRIYACEWRCGIIMLTYVRVCSFTVLASIPTENTNYINSVPFCTGALEHITSDGTSWN